MRDGQRRSRPLHPVFLFPFRHRHSLLGHPVPLGNSASFTVGLPERVMRPGPQPGFTRSARVRRGRGGCPLCPGAVVSLPAGQHPQPGTCASQRLALHPAKASTCEARNHETSVKGSVVHPSGLLLARGPRVAREPFGFPPSSAPCRYRQRTSGRRQVIRTQTRSYTIGITEPPSYSPLNSCDLVSQCCLSAAGIRFLGTLSRQGLPPLLRSAYRRACAFPRLHGGPWRGFHVPHA
jgi:hypothetical protein